MPAFFRKYLLPAFVFQSIIVAGGYGTGQELLIFFLNMGPLAGLLGMVLVVVPVISISAMVAYEFARVLRAYDYRTFLRHLLGRGWFVWEIGFLTSLVVFFGVIGAAAGEILSKTFGLPYWSGTLGLMAVVAFLVFEGTTVIERVLASWSFVLYATYTLFFIWMLQRFGGNLQVLDWGTLETEWLTSGLRYGALQLSMLPATLFCLHHISTRREALGAGLLTGPIAMIPGFLFYMVMLTHYPAINAQVLPSNFLLESLGSRWFQIFFQVVLLGTLIETATGVIHSFNERLASYYRSRNQDMPRAARPVTAAVLITGASLMAKIGLVGLLMLAFNYMGWFFLLLFIGPLFTVGLFKLWRARPLPAVT